MYGHAHLLAVMCERCGNNPHIVVADDGARLCARCGLGDEQSNQQKGSAMTTKTGIKCGSCKNYHDTVAQVRLCYERKDRAQETVDIQAKEREDDIRAYASKPDAVLFDSEEDEAAARLDTMTGSHGRDMASPKQVRYVMDLLTEHDWPDDITQANVENMERRQVSKLIDNLKASPRIGAAGSTKSVVPDVPAGRYALLEARGGPQENDHVIRFYQVDRPVDGKWAGRTFLKQLIGAPGDWRKDDVRGMRAARVLAQIQVNPESASILFGKESKECGVCHSPLSTKASRQRGIGPKCASKTGWGA